MNESRILAIIWRHIYEIKHSWDHIADILFWPLIDIVVWGFVTIYLTKDASGYNLVSLLLGAVILWGAFFSIQRDMSVGFLDEVWSRNILNLFSTPLTIWEYITGLTVVNVVKMLLGLLATALIAWAFYSFNIFPYALKLFPFFANLLIFGLSLGIVITGLVFRYTTKVQVLAWGFAGLLQPISCVFYPLSILPMTLQKIALLLPTTHSFEGMRQILSTGTFSVNHFFWGLILNIFYLAFALIFFKKIFEITKNKGLLVKLD